MASMTPFASIVIPTYNRAALLGRAIQSALAQTVQDVEVIVVDDGSADGTSAAVSAFKDSRIKYLRHPHNLGAAAAVNTGIEAAQGSYVGLLDSDDAVRQNWIERLGSIMESDLQVGIAWGWKGIHDETGRLRSVAFVDPFRRQGIRTLLPLMLTWTPGAGGMLVRRDVFNIIGLFDPELSNLADVDFGVRFALAGRWGVSVVQEVLYDGYFCGEHISSGLHAGYLRSLEAYVIKYDSVFSRYPAAKAYWMYRLARLHFDAGNCLRARECLIAAVRARPGWMKPWAWDMARRCRLLGIWRAIGAWRIRRQEEQRLRAYLQP